MIQELQRQMRRDETDETGKSPPTRPTDKAEKPTQPALVARWRTSTATHHNPRASSALTGNGRTENGKCGNGNLGSAVTLLNPSQTTTPLSRSRSFAPMRFRAMLTP